jgi:DNA-binding XRE family transcriptional regulator
MIQLDPAKLAKLKTAEQLFTERYGKPGTPSRIAFEEKALTGYYCELLKERRKELKLTQKQLAEKIGRERSYIAHIEQGKTDIQLSGFLRISGALGLNFSLQP